MSSRTVLVIHPDQQRRQQLSAALAEHQVISVENRQQALQQLSKCAPSLVVSHHEDFKKLLKDLERHAPRAIRAVLWPEADRQSRDGLVEAAAEGHQFIAIEDHAAEHSIESILVARDSGRRAPKDSLSVRFWARDAVWEGTLVDVGNDGLALALPVAAPAERLSPGTSLAGLHVIGADGSIPLEIASAVVRTLRPIPGSETVRVGISFTDLREDSVAPAAQIRDEVRIRGLVRRAFKLGESFSVNELGQDRAIQVAPSQVGATADSFVLRVDGISAHTFRAGDLLTVAFEIAGRGYRGTTSVLLVSSDSIVLAMPRALQLRHRRSSLRIRGAAELEFAVSFVSPLTGERVHRRLVDVHPSGCSFVFDGAFEVFPPGLLLEGVTVHVGGSAVRCDARVQSATGMVDAQTEGQPQTRRCGLKLLNLSPSDRQALLDRLVAARVPEVEDGSRFEFSAIWELFGAAKVQFPDYPLGNGPHLAALESAHRALGDGHHGLSKSLVYRKDGSLHGHSSGLRIYSKTWLSQHLVVRPGYHRGETISQELVNLMLDYAEALDDVEYIRGLWRAHNRWTSRIYGAIVGKVDKPSLTAFSSFTPCRLPVTQRLPSDPAWRVREATRADVELLLKHLRRTSDVAALLSSDFVEGEMSLESLGGRFERIGMRRGRSFGVIDGTHGPAAFVVMEDITPGLFWAEWYNAFRIVLVDPAHPNPDALRRNLAAYAQAQAAQRGRPVAECLATDDDVPVLEGLGFQNLGKVMEWTMHRTVVREWADHLAAVFERVNRTMASASSARPGPEEDAA